MNKYLLFLPALLLITLASNADVKMFIKGSFPLTCGQHYKFLSPAYVQVLIPADEPIEFITPDTDGSFSTSTNLGTPFKVVGAAAVCSKDCKDDLKCMQSTCEPSIGAYGKVTEAGTITVTCQ